MKLSNKVYDVLKWIAMYLLRRSEPCILLFLASGGSHTGNRW